MNMVARLAQISPHDARKQMLIGGKQKCLETIGRYVHVGGRHFLLMSSNSYSREEIQRFADEVIAEVHQAVGRQGQFTLLRSIASFVTPEGSFDELEGALRIAAHLD